MHDPEQFPPLFRDCLLGHKAAGGSTAEIQLKEFVDHESAQKESHHLPLEQMPNGQDQPLRLAQQTQCLEPAIHFREPQKKSLHFY